MSDAVAGAENGKSIGRNVVDGAIWLADLPFGEVGAKQMKESKAAGSVASYIDKLVPGSDKKLTTGQYIVDGTILIADLPFAELGAKQAMESAAAKSVASYIDIGVAALHKDYGINQPSEKK